VLGKTNFFLLRLFIIETLGLQCKDGKFYSVDGYQKIYFIKQELLLNSHVPSLIVMLDDLERLPIFAVSVTVEILAGGFPNY